jgi:endonuclease G
MKKLLAAFFLFGLLVSAHAQPPSCERHFFQKAAPEVTRKTLQTSTVGLCFEAFAVLHSGVSKTPLWSAEHLTRDSLKAAREIPRADSFHAEPALPPGQGAELADYVRSGFDRGHMAPAADMPTAQAQHESFSLANIVPQNRKNNQILWSAIEGATRHLTNLRGELYVITGPVFEGEKSNALMVECWYPPMYSKRCSIPASKKPPHGLRRTMIAASIRRSASLRWSGVSV